ncbi:LysR family transcriptional regulator [Cohnella terricola]|uniref:LysR family transcriptional regulator n=1 Tax=Cohnella terricola TaxID=1289167 RepID=A0A559JQ12_9BACL|nr:LysR family transcriptional regulator [Cohnella terricola]TVY01943.1 LysR family transcriptional regulator [Cohnella terricola]
MESQDMRIFRAVAREGTITKAAERLGYVQSNVTARIRQLEADLETALFYRHNRGMTLTSSGKMLLGYADKIVGLLEEATTALSSATEPSGPLAIGSTQTAAAVRLPKLLAAYHERFPNVRLSVTAGHTQAMIEKVLRHELDGAFIGFTNTHPELRSVPAFEEELTIVTPPAVADLSEALTKPILVFTKGCSYRVILEEWLAASGNSDALTMEFGTLEAIVGGVSAGLGITLMPVSVVNKQLIEGSLKSFFLPEPYRKMKTEFVMRKDSFVGKPLLAFLELLQKR